MLISKHVLNVKKRVLRRLTDFSFESSRPAISANGKYFVFESAGDPFGTNADGSTELFFGRVTKSSVEIMQITDGAPGTISERAVMDKSGKRVFFQSDADLTGGGAGFDHIFMYVR